MNVKLNRNREGKWNTDEDVKWISNSQNKFNCVPLLTYAIEVVHVMNRDERRQLQVVMLTIPA